MQGIVVFGLGIILAPLEQLRERNQDDRLANQRRLTVKTMPHKLIAIRENTKARRGSSIILLPADWTMLMVAKLLHCFAYRYVKSLSAYISETKYCIMTDSL